MIRVAAIVSLVALSACGSGGTGPILGAAIEEAGGLLPRDERVVERKAPKQKVTRAAIEKAGIAAVWARLESDPSPTLMYAASDNGGYVTYLSGFQQSLTLRGSRITATRGVGTDLLSSWGEGADPVARPTAVQNWPARAQRVYELPADAPQGRLVKVDCYFEPPEPQTMVILERQYSGYSVAEICSGDGESFENLYFAEARSGTVLRSLQWVGPDVDLIDLQILEPYTEN